MGVSEPGAPVPAGIVGKIQKNGNLTAGRVIVYIHHQFSGLGRCLPVYRFHGIILLVRPDAAEFKRIFKRGIPGEVFHVLRKAPLIPGGTVRVAYREVSTALEITDLFMRNKSKEIRSDSRPDSIRLSQ